MKSLAFKEILASFLSELLELFWSFSITDISLLYKDISKYCLLLFPPKNSFSNFNKISF